MHAFFRSVAAIIVVSGVAGCTSISYYAQSLKGHVEIMTARQDVGELIDDPSTPRTLRARIADWLLAGPRKLAFIPAAPSLVK
ncbi:MAG: hypothetical protein E5W72_13800 [Mesorhizobium sp.]|nr:MAG: hypothetical protein E5W87_26155 [Mesorhizobium sp.]TIT50342.1 MAG: hypothetical protein E5W72_13800 [Mesorhizobium sp.]